MHAVAAHGLTGSAQALPYLEQIQRSFGAGHDVSQIRAVVGGSAKQASERMGASGYASGRSVAFREWPDLALAAHEAAHVIQQRAGVNLEGGVGKQGDEYEQHADAVAERVVAGRSAESLLAPYKDKFQSSHAVQHKKPKDEPSTPLQALLKQLKEPDCKGAAAALDLDAIEARARELDTFCGDVDIAIGLSVVARTGQQFQGTTIRALAESSGLQLKADGQFHFEDADGVPQFTLDNQDAEPFFPDSMRNLSTTGITFLLDVPRASGAVSSFDRMVQITKKFATTLDGIIVDDNRQPLNDKGLDAIRRHLAGVYVAMENAGIPAGSPLAMRLFS